MLTRHDGSQESLSLRVLRESGSEVSDESVAKRPDFLSAINFCIEVGALQDNLIASEIGMDEGQFSRCRKGRAHFPPSKIDSIEDTCGNEIPTRWKALNRGYGLVRLKSAVEAELEVVNRENEALKLKLDNFKEFAGIAASLKVARE